MYVTEEPSAYSVHPNTRVNILAGSHRGKTGVIGSAKPTHHSHKGKIQVLVGHQNKPTWCKPEWLQVISSDQEQQPTPVQAIESTVGEDINKDVSSSSVWDEQLGVDATTLVPTVTVASGDSAFEELSPEEEVERHRLELKVERAFYEAGAALRELRDKRLYRSTHKTFEQYCRDRFGMERRYPYRLIDAAAVVDNLQEFCVQFGHIFPTNEAQCRELAKLPPPQQPDAWIESVNSIGGKKVPPAATVRGVVQAIKERDTTPPPISYSKGDVVMIRGKGNPDLRKHDGCWAVVVGVNEYTVVVSLDGKDISVKPQFLEDIEPEYWANIKEIQERVHKLQKCDLDPVDDAVLEVLLRRTCFTERQMIVLQRLEQDYVSD